MGIKRQQMRLRQKAALELELKNRMLFLAEKGIADRRADKDTLVRGIKAKIKSVDRGLKWYAENEKKTEEIAKAKAAREAAPSEEKPGGKAEKPKKAPEEGKGKKVKSEKKAAPPNAQEGGHSQQAPKGPQEGKAD